MVTFTTTTLSGVQQPQLSHSGFPREGPCLASAQRRGPPEIKNKNSDMRNTTLDRCPCLHQPLPSWK